MKKFIRPQYGILLKTEEIAFAKLTDKGLHGGEINVILKNGKEITFPVGLVDWEYIAKELVGDKSK